MSASVLKSRQHDCHFDPKTRSTTVISSRWHNCHFEPKARNLAFPFLPVLRRRALALMGMDALVAAHLFSSAVCVESGGGTFGSDIQSCGIGEIFDNARIA